MLVAIIAARSLVALTVLVLALWLTTAPAGAGVVPAVPHDLGAAFAAMPATTRFDAGDLVGLFLAVFVGTGGLGSAATVVYRIGKALRADRAAAMTGEPRGAGGASTG